MYDPDSYDAFSQFQRRDAEEILPYLVNKMNWQNRQRILDFGCGSGFITKHVLLPLVDAKTKNSSHVLAVDLSEKMIHFATAKYSAKNLTYMVKDLLKEPEDFPSQFHKIFSCHVLHWIQDQEKAVTCLYNLLHPQGELGLYFIARAPVFSVYEAMGANPKWKSYLSDVSEFIPWTNFNTDYLTQFRQILTSVGFYVQEVTSLARKFKFDSVEMLNGKSLMLNAIFLPVVSHLDAAMAVNPFLHRIPISLQREYKDDFLHEWLKLVKCSNNPDSTVEVGYEMLLVRAKRA